MTNTPLSIRRIKKIASFIFLGWVVVFIVLFNTTLNFSWPISIADSVITNGLLALACIILSNLLGFYQPKNETIVFVLALTFILALFITFASKFLLLALFSDQQTYINFLKFSLTVRFLILFVFIAWCALANILWYRLEEQSATQERLLAAQNLSKEAELNKLRHQLQPHFLFNSLNSVYALTIVNPKEAGTMITRLASFLRGTLKRDDEVWVNVAEEMEYIGLYLDIEKVRFSHRLNIDVKIAEETLNLCLPGTLLQPIVENAIKFGLYNTAAAITISMEVKLQHNHLVITVQNPFDPELKATGGTGFGLSAIRRRLYLLFADEKLLRTEATPDNMFITTLKIPQQNDENNTD
ncbi:two-component system LytT family sensor kinase [Pedobacter africanus]|uniref:Sensor histidine kinase YesM n=1 Tax=Pedobacter africanus TaxID=151894 RepID=A0ACC6KUY3_9SPHI|nr:histidine kinase [Pedobacter africanus]MDR6782955.1 sensor histidine kinase YesM [Pedobacter africanus]